MGIGHLPGRYCWSWSWRWWTSRSSDDRRVSCSSSDTSTTCRRASCARTRPSTSTCSDRSLDSSRPGMARRRQWRRSTWSRRVAVLSVAPRCVLRRPEQLNRQPRNQRRCQSTPAAVCPHPPSSPMYSPSAAGTYLGDPCACSALKEKIM